MGAIPTIKTEVNLNTLLMLVGFASTLIGIGASWSKVTAAQASMQEFVTAQRALNARFDERINNAVADIAGLPGVTYRVTKLEEGAGALDQRLTRLGESNQRDLGDLRTALGSIQTAIALNTRALERIEAWRERGAPVLPGGGG